MKRLLKKLLAVALCAALIGGTAVTLPVVMPDSGIVASAATYGDFEYEVLNEGTVEITGYSGSGGDVTIPSEIDGKSVTSIGGGAFIYCSKLASITIPNSVMSVGKYAFGYCSKLESIIIPSSVTSIDNEAFCCCTNIANIIVDENNTNYSSLDGVLYNKDLSEILLCPIKKTSINIPDSVTSIGDSAFDSCTGLTSITIPDSVISIGKGAFDSCTGLTSITIPDSVTSIGDYAFWRCTGLTSITIPDSVISIGKSAFDRCTGLTSITIPDSVTSIGRNAFQNCTELTSITIPDSVTSIGQETFAGCTMLTSITIPDSVNSIGIYAFHGCTGLTSITIPDNVMSVGELAFSGCTNLTNVTISDSVTRIDEKAFYGCISLSNITIPDSVTYIGSCAFGYYESNWRAVQNPDFVICGKTGSTAETYAKGRDFKFIDIDSEVLVNISDINEKETFTNSSVTILGSAVGGKAPYTYQYFYKKTTDSNWTKIAGYSTDKSKTFKPASAGTYIVRVNVKDSTGQIVQKDINLNVEYEFEYTTDSNSEITITNHKGNAETVEIPSEINGISVTSIGENAFFNHSIIKNINIPDSVTSIDNYAFHGCDGLKSITIPDSVTSIGEGAFENCHGLTNVKILSGVTNIGSYAFCWCDNLTNLTIPDGLEIIEDYAFFQCYNLKNIIIPETVTTIGEDAIGFFTDSFHPYTTAIDGVIIYGAVGSAAETYANKNGFKFVSTAADTELKNSSSISAANVTAGTEVTMTGKATGGTNPYKFAYYYKKATDSAWTRVYTTPAGNAYTKITEMTFKPTTAGTYNIRINVKDNNGTGILATKEFTVKVAGEKLKNNSTVSATSITAGGEITLNGKAEGGTSPYKFAYYYKKLTDSAWTRVYTTPAGYAYTKNAEMTFKPTTAGTYNIRINVKDDNGTGTMVSKEFTITVKADASDVLTNNSTVSATNVTAGTEVTMTGKATGGTSPYKYAYYYKKSTESTWTKAYVTSSGSAYTKYDSMKFTPKTAGTYDVRINVKDEYGNGKTVTKDFKITVK